MTGAGGFVQGAMQYAFHFVALPGAPANCTQSVTITVDGDVIVFYLVVP